MAILMASLFVLLVSGFPIAFALGLSSAITVLALGNLPLTLLPQRMFTSVDSSSFLAVPLFIIAGEVMSKGSVAKKIFDFANSLVGHIPGGLGHVNVLGSVFFAGMSGSAAADAAGLGALEIEAMTQAGFDRDFSCAMTAASACIGPIIPPSILMIIYGMLTEASVTQLFLGGIIPGLLMAIGLMIYAFIQSKRKNYPRQPWPSFKIVWRELRKSFFALITPFIIMGGIVGGVFTPTEAAVMAVFYTLFVSFFIHRDMKLCELPQVFLRAAVTCSTVMLIVACASLFAWLVTMFRLPNSMHAFLIQYISSPYILLLMINIVLLIAGMFENGSGALVMFVPVFYPLIVSYGIDPVHFGVMCVFNLVIGGLTPPVGIVLFITATVGKIPIERLVKALLIPIAILVAVLMIVTYIPSVVLFVPSLLY
jgi:C4-dicarboxylate transporter DctM subunit